MPSLAPLILAAKTKAIRLGRALGQVMGSVVATLTLASCAPISSDSLTPVTTLVKASPLYGENGQWTGPIKGENGVLLPVLMASSFSSNDPRFGGLSGLSLSADGMLTAISDHGYWARARLSAQSGQPPQDWSLDWLLNTNGLPPAERAWSDAEDITQLANGGFLVSYERHHRLWYYPPRADGSSPLSGAAQSVETSPALQEAPNNGGLEAITTLQDGRIILILEGKGGQAETTGWVGTPHTAWSDHSPSLDWVPFTLTLSDGMSPTAVTVLDDGQPSATLILLERYFSLTTGFSSRLRRITLTDFTSRLEKGIPIKPETLAWLQAPPVNDNWEGLAVDPRHPSSLWVLTDDNYNSFQRTMLLELDCTLCAKRPQ